MNLDGLAPLPVSTRPVRVLGVDLTADEGVTCAAAVLRWDGEWRLEALSSPLNSNATIVRCAQSFELVALDGPRYPPTGFQRFVARGEKPPPDGARSRACEREHVRRVCPIFYSSPVATAGMQRWMVRSWGLFDSLDQRPIEIYPMGGFVAALNGVQKRRPHALPKKSSSAGQEARQVILERILGLPVGDFVARAQGSEKAHDRIDAVMAAITAAAHLLGVTIGLGDPSDGTLEVPDLRRQAPR